MNFPNNRLSMHQAPQAMFRRGDGPKPALGGLGVSDPLSYWLKLSCHLAVAAMMLCLGVATLNSALWNENSTMSSIDTKAPTMVSAKHGAVAFESRHPSGNGAKLSQAAILKAEESEFDKEDLLPDNDAGLACACAPASHESAHAWIHGCPFNKISFVAQKAQFPRGPPA